MLRYQSQTSPYKSVLAQKLAQVRSSSAASPVPMKFRTWIYDYFRIILVPTLYEKFVPFILKFHRFYTSTSTSKFMIGDLQPYGSTRYVNLV